jgi:DMSO/TMAO reductase YedYZ heme-binding membrane subunit
LGVGAFCLGLIHTLHMVDHSWGWNPRTMLFMLPSHQIGIWAGIFALILMVPAVVTSFDRAVQNLGIYWRKIHILTLPALILGCMHGILIGSHYLGKLAWDSDAILRVLLLVFFTLLVLAVRSPWMWKLCALQKYYTPPNT